MLKRLSRKYLDGLRREVDRILGHTVYPVVGTSAPRPVVQRSVFDAWSKPRGTSTRTARRHTVKRGQLRRMVDF